MSKVISTAQAALSVVPFGQIFNVVQVAVSTIHDLYTVYTSVPDELRELCAKLEAFSQFSEAQVLKV